MALFDNVTYIYYSDTLGRSVIPTADDFNALKSTNIQEVKNILPYLEPREENGIDAAVCMRIEKEYLANINGDAAAVSSETLSGHSVSYDMNVKAKIDKPLAAQKMDVTKLYCYVRPGVM